MKPKLDDLEEFDLGITTYEVNEIEEVKEYQRRIQKVKKLLYPFLDKLMQDPQKDIHWPNRDKIIGNFKIKLTDILDGSDTIGTKE